MSESVALIDRAKLFLGYLDKEMRIMGVLSAFCAATLALALGKIVTVKIEPETQQRVSMHDAASILVRSPAELSNINDVEVGALIWRLGHWYFIGGSAWLLTATLFFYRQRSYLAWYYGQISLLIALPEDREWLVNREWLVSYKAWLKYADSWATWLHYRWAFAAATMGIGSYLLAILCVEWQWLDTKTVLLIYLLGCAGILIAVWIHTFVLKTYQFEDRPWATTLRKMSGRIARK
jgi:hypothetical protein